MKIEESLKKYGTITYSRDYFEKIIGFGSPIISEYGEFKGFNKNINGNILNCGVWLSFVPKGSIKYMEFCVKKAGEEIVNGKCDERTRLFFCSRLEAWIDRSLKNCSNNY